VTTPAKVDWLANWEQLGPIERDQYVGYLRTWAIGESEEAGVFWNRVADLAAGGMHPIDAITQTAKEQNK